MTSLIFRRLTASKVERMLPMSRKEWPPCEVKLCVLIGLLVAALYTACVLVLYAISGPAAFSAKGTSLGEVVAAYLAAAVVGGAAIGFLLPLRRTFAGAVILGAIGGAIVCICVYFALGGPFWRWNTNDWLTVGILALALGPATAVLVRKSLL